MISWRKGRSRWGQDGFCGPLSHPAPWSCSVLIAKIKQSSLKRQINKPDKARCQGVAGEGLAWCPCSFCRIFLGGRSSFILGWWAEQSCRLLLHSPSLHSGQTNIPGVAVTVPRAAEDRTEPRRGTSWDPACACCLLTHFPLLCCLLHCPVLPGSAHRPPWPDLTLDFLLGCFCKPCISKNGWRHSFRKKKKPKQTNSTKTDPFIFSRRHHQAPSAPRAHKMCPIKHTWRHKRCLQPGLTQGLLN